MLAPSQRKAEPRPRRHSGTRWPSDQRYRRVVDGSLSPRYCRVRTANQAPPVRCSYGLTATPAGPFWPETRVVTPVPSRLASLTVPAKALVQYRWLLSTASPVGTFWPETLEAKAAGGEGLAYHAAYSVLAAITMAVLVKFAWPKHLEDVQPPTEPTTEPREEH